MSPAGELDLVFGNSDGSLTYIENTGTSTAPVFVQRTGSANPFDGIDVGSDSAPAFADIDGDSTLRPRHLTRATQLTFLSLAGDLDLVVGEEWEEQLIYFENTGTSTWL